VKNCRADGKNMKFMDYLTENHIDTNLPLVADYNGIPINVSIKSLSQADQTWSSTPPYLTGRNRLPRR
jgi:uncharacterized lipoprotein NlpE involved in copper resistance